MPQSRARHEQGFSVAELMVVVLVMGILMAIALPVLQGARRRAADRVAQSATRLAVTTARVVQTPEETAPAITVSASALATAEPSLRFVDGATASDGPRVASTSVTETPAGPVVDVAVRSTSGACFLVRDAAGTVAFARTEPDTAEECSGAAGAAADAAAFTP